MNSETPSAPAPEAQEPVAPPLNAVTALLAEFASETDLKAIVIGFIRTNGQAGVRMTPMSAQDANHLSRILDVRVQREYATMLFATPVARAPVGAVRPNVTPKEIQVAQAVNRLKKSGKGK